MARRTLAITVARLAINVARLDYIREGCEQQIDIQPFATGNLLSRGDTSAVGHLDLHAGLGLKARNRFIQRFPDGAGRQESDFTLRGALAEMPKARATARSNGSRRIKVPPKIAATNLQTPT